MQVYDAESGKLVPKKKGITLRMLLSHTGTFFPFLRFPPASTDLIWAVMKLGSATRSSTSD